MLSQLLMECLGMSQQRSHCYEYDADDEDYEEDDEDDEDDGDGDGDGDEEYDGRALNRMCWMEARPTLMLLIHWSITAIARHTR